MHRRVGPIHQSPSLFFAFAMLCRYYFVFVVGKSILMPRLPQCRDVIAFGKVTFLLPSVRLPRRTHVRVLLSLEHNTTRFDQVITMLGKCTVLPHCCLVVGVW